MSAKRRSRYQPTTSRSGYGSSTTYNLRFNSIVDFIESEGARLSRRSESVLRQLATTLDENIAHAQAVLAPREDPRQEQAAATRLSLAEARLSKSQQEANAAYLSAPLPWRWLGWGVAAAPRQAVSEAKLEVDRAQKAWAAVVDEVKRRKVTAWPYPLDNASNAQQFLARALPARITLHNAMLGDLRRVEEERVARDRAMAAAHMDRVRDEADQIKKCLPRDHPCPYCGKALGTDPCADHIHPVSHGGQSHQNNMVYVCSNCNLAKSNKTLREFAQRKGFNREEIEQRLIFLGKRV